MAVRPSHVVWWFAKTSQKRLFIRSNLAACLCQGGAAVYSKIACKPVKVALKSGLVESDPSVVAIAMVSRFPGKVIGILAASAAVSLLFAATAGASIEMPSQLFDEGEVFAGSDELPSESGATDTGAMESPDEQPASAEESPFVFRVRLKAIPSSGSSSSSSGTSSSSGPSGAGGTSCMLATMLTIVGDDDCIERVAVEQTLLLPDAPGAELFHPPRDGRS